MKRKCNKEMRQKICVAGVWMLMAVSAFASGGGNTVVQILEGTFKAENDQSAQRTIAVTKVEYRPVSAVYVVRGNVRYENVEGAAYLEMWSVMPDGSRYFSRTLGEFGAMRKIQGMSAWRKFELPFNLMDAKPESVTLEINVVMPGKGSIELKGLTVGDPRQTVRGMRGVEWWSNSKMELVGSFLGSALGLFGALIGCLGGILAPQGKGRRFVMSLLVFSVVTGIVLLIAGLTALCLGQPYHVWYPLVMSGGICVVVVMFIFPALRRSYAQAERRRIEALDA